MHRFLALAGVCTLVAACSSGDKPVDKTTTVVLQPCVVLYKNAKGQTMKTTSYNSVTGQPCTTVIYGSGFDSVVTDTTKMLLDSVATEGAPGNLTSFVRRGSGVTQAGKKRP